MLNLEIFFIIISYLLETKQNDNKNRNNDLMELERERERERIEK